MRLLFTSLFILCVIGAYATDYYSKTSGDARTLANWSTARNGSGTAPANFTGTTDVFFIQNGHSMTTATGASWTVTNKIQIENGGTLTANSGTAGQVVVVGNFQIDDGGSYIHDVYSATGNGNGADIPGTTSRTFATNSNVTILKWGNGSGVVAIPTVTYGNLTWNAPCGAMQLINSATNGGILNLTVNNLSILNTGTGQMRINASLGNAAVGNININGNFTVGGSAVVNINPGFYSCTVNLNIKGDFTWKDNASIINYNSSMGFTLGSANINFVGTAVQKYTHTSSYQFPGQNIAINVNSGATLDASTSTVAKGATAFTLNAGATLRIGDPLGISITGSGNTGNVWGGTRTFNSGANYEYTGTVPQVTGTGIPASVNTLTINNPAGVTSTYSTAVTTLKLVNGNLILTDKHIVIRNIGSIIGGAANSYVQTDGTLPAPGTLKNYVASSPVVFPVGGSSYNPVTIQNVGASGIDQFSVYVFDGVTNNSISGGTSITNNVNHPLVNRTWNIARLSNNSPANNITITPQWNKGEESPATAFDYNHVYAERYNGSAWVNNLAPATPATAPAAVDLSGSGAGPFTTTQTGLTSLTAFTVASTVFSTIKDTITGSSFCSGTSLNVPFTIVGTFNTGNVFTAELSDASGSFASPVSIGTLSGTTAGTINATIPATTPAGTGYRIRVVSSNPNVIGTPNGINLTINPTLTPSVSLSVSPNDTICTGTSVTFTASPLNPGTNPQYEWKKGATTLSASGTTYTDNGLANGDIITLTMTSNATCASTTPVVSNAITMVVNNLVTPAVFVTSSPGDTICAGTAVTFTATPSNGGSTPVYQWKKGSANVGANNATYIDNGLVNGDVITVTLTSNIACASTTSATSTAHTMSVTPVVTPDISISVNPNDTICSGTMAIFNATALNSGNAPIYQWRKNGLTVGTNSNTYSDAVINGDAILCIMASNLKCVTKAKDTSNEITMVVNSSIPPKVSITATPGTNVGAGQTVSFRATVSNGGLTPTYQWQKNGVNVGSNSSVYNTNNLANSDTITCIVHSSLVCATPDSVRSNGLVIKITSGIAEITEDNDIIMFPNPNNGRFSIEGKMADAKEANIEVYNVVGQLLYKAKAPIQQGTIKEQVLLPDASANGFYLLRIETPDSKRTIRFVIEK